MGANSRRVLKVIHNIKKPVRVFSMFHLSNMEKHQLAIMIWLVGTLLLDKIDVRKRISNLWRALSTHSDGG